MNQAMRIERENVLQAESHQRTTGRQGYANGFKPKTLKTRVGEVSLQIPQTRDYHDENGHPFYPQSLDRGVRSERARTLAVAEMYVPGCQRAECHQDPKRHGTRAEDGDGLDGARDLRRIFDADKSAEAQRRLRETVTRYQKTAPDPRLLARRLLSRKPSRCYESRRSTAADSAPHMDWNASIEK